MKSNSEIIEGYNKLLLEIVQVRRIYDLLIEDINKYPGDYLKKMKLLLFMSLTDRNGNVQGQEILTMFFVDGLDEKSISEILNVPIYKVIRRKKHAIYCIRNFGFRYDYDLLWGSLA